VHLGHGLLDEVAIFPALQRQPVFRERFVVVRLLAEGEAEIEVRELRLLAHLHLHDARGVPSGFLDVLAIRGEREVRVRARERRIEIDRALGDLTGLVVPAGVSEDEAEQIQRLVVLWIELDRALQQRQRVLVEAAVVRDLAEIEMHQRALGIDGERLLEPAARDVDVANRFLGESDLDQRAEIMRVVLEQLLEFGDRVRVATEQRRGAPQFPACFAIARRRAQQFAEVGDALVGGAAVEIGDLEITLRHLHARVELQRAHERVHRFLVQSLVVVQDAEVVVRSGVGRIDPAGKGTENVTVPIRRHGSWRRSVRGRFPELDRYSHPSTR